ncbi:MAG: hypothetical protein ACPGPI_01865 [Longimicrobiales bacterium]
MLTLRRGTRIACSALVLFALASATAYAQSRDLPRTAAGKPDMNGIWQALGNAHWDIEPHTARPALAMQPGPVVPVPASEVLALGAVGSVPSGYGVVVGGRIPYLPEAATRRDENREQWLDRDPEIKCYLPGVPRATYMPFPFQLFQSDTHVAITYEYATAFREIYLEDPGEPQVDSWMGQSFGTWDGDTFVVRVNGMLGDAWLDRAGNFTGYGTTVTERYTMISPDHIMYEAEIENPETFSEPWTIRMPLYRNIDPNARLGQFKCVEFVEELMYGHLRKNPIRGNGS